MLGNYHDYIFKVGNFTFFDHFFENLKDKNTPQVCRVMVTSGCPACFSTSPWIFCWSLTTLPTIHGLDGPDLTTQWPAVFGSQQPGPPLRSANHLATEIGSEMSGQNQSSKDCFI